MLQTEQTSAALVVAIESFGVLGNCMTEDATLPNQIGPYRNRVIGLQVMPLGAA
jgi:hypothetical protein